MTQKWRQYAETLQTEYGPMVVPIHDVNQRDALIATGRGHAHDGAVMLRELLPEKGTFIDVGANIGVYTMVMARRAGITLAFEPQPVIATMLDETVRLNHLDNKVVSVCTCLGATDGDIELPQFDYGSRLNFGSIEFGPTQIEKLDQERRTDRTPEFVPLRRLDFFDLKRLHVLKIDVQRMELDVLAGAAETIRRCRPIMLVEWVLQDADKLSAAIEALGYRYEIVGDDWLCFPLT